MAEYSSLKVPELKKLLGDRGLPVAGNKADLIARLQADDAAKATTTEAAPAEDEIDYSDDEPAAAEPAPAAVEEPVVTEPEPVATETPAVAEPTATEPATETAPETATEAVETVAEPAAEPIIAAEPLDLAAEAQKRAERLKRFGGTDDAEEAARVERAARFGLSEDSSVSRMLNEALPERQSRKRGRGDNGGQNQQNKRQSMDRRGGRNGGNNHQHHGHHGQNNNNARRQGGHNGGRRDGNNGGRRDGQGQRDAPARKSVLDDPVEKAKAEARSKRFAA